MEAERAEFMSMDVSKIAQFEEQLTRAEFTPTARELQGELVEALGKFQSDQNGKQVLRSIQACAKKAGVGLSTEEAKSWLDGRFLLAFKPIPDLSGFEGRLLAS